MYFTGSTSETTIFVGNILEKHTAGSLTEYRHYIKVGSQAVALHTRPSSGSPTTQYFLLDHLGSVAEITNSAGSVDVSESFSAFGQRRDPTDWSGPISSGDESTIGSTTPRGYTFHTNLESSSLIHMNGRVADSLTGRFLSPDPYVPYPEATQSFNRYSYVRNNPLTFSDPSGFQTVGVQCGPNPYCIVGVALFSYYLSSVFGDSDEPKIPNGCWVQANGCYGRAGSLKLAQVASDVVRTPGSNLDGFENRSAGINSIEAANSGGTITYVYETDGLEFFKSAVERFRPELDLEFPSGNHIVKVRMGNVNEGDLMEVPMDELAIVVSSATDSDTLKNWGMSARIRSSVFHELVHINQELRGIERRGKLNHARNEVEAYRRQIAKLRKYGLLSDEQFRNMIETQLEVNRAIIAEWERGGGQ